MILVTAAILEKNGLIFAARKRKGLHLAGFWEFPGGKVEANESEQECLKRELEEEFGIECVIGDFVAESIHNYGDKSIRLRGYRATYLCGEFKPIDHDRTCWLPITELMSLDWAPADIPIVQKVIEDRGKKLNNSLQRISLFTENLDLP